MDPVIVFCHRMTNQMNQHPLVVFLCGQDMNRPIFKTTMSIRTDVSWTCPQTAWNPPKIFFIPTGEKQFFDTEEFSFEAGQRGISFRLIEK